MSIWFSILLYAMAHILALIYFKILKKINFKKNDWFASVFVSILVPVFFVSILMTSYFIWYKL